MSLALSKSRRLFVLALLACVFPSGSALAASFHLGNSLTNDTRPDLIPDAEFSIFCGKSLNYIIDNPTDYCVSGSLEWPTALANNTYDTVVVQPYPNDTLASATEDITMLMGLQPNAKFIIHTGWPIYFGLLDKYNSNTTIFHRAFFDALADALPRPTLRTYALDALAFIAEDPNSPYDDLSEIYRDLLHLEVGDGRYLVHNLLRRSMGLPLVTTWSETLNNKSYIDSLLAKEDYDWNGDTDGNDFLLWQQSYTGAGEGFSWGEGVGGSPLQAVPEPTSFMLLGMACCYGVSRRQRRTV